MQRAAAYPGAVMSEHNDDELARRERARRLHKEIEQLDERRPARTSTPRDFTDRKAKEAAAQERERLKRRRED